MTRSGVFAATAALWLAVSPALAQGVAPASAASVACVLPPAPPGDDQRPPALAPQPPLPSCVDPSTKIAHCPKSVVDRFNASINAYNSGLMAHQAAGQVFLDKLNAWTRAAQAYDVCEVNALNAGLH